MTFSTLSNACESFMVGPRVVAQTPCCMLSSKFSIEFDLMMKKRALSLKTGFYWSIILNVSSFLLL